jgi:hypothetical protein
MYKRTLFLIFILIILALLSCEKTKGTITAPFEQNPDTLCVRKPNIYIYPTQKIKLDVYLNFPNGGSIVQSSPQYNNGWKITVDTSGLIDDEYHYLFYECRVPNYFQKEKGWIIKQKNLENFFRKNLSLTGFLNKEMEDFIEYWIPRLDYSTEYIIYPQFRNDIIPLIELNISEIPDCILRYFYLIEENSKGIITIDKPVIPTFKRSEFTVAEWGVIIY